MPPVSFPINGYEGNHSRHHSTLQLVDLTHRIGLKNIITYFYHFSQVQKIKNVLLKGYEYKLSYITDYH